MNERSLQAGVLTALRRSLEELVEEGVEIAPRPDASSAPEMGTPSPTPHRPGQPTLALTNAGEVVDRAAALAQIRRELGECTRCRLHEGRNAIVFGEGAPTAPVVFVGEGPGAEEDRTGRPFVGRAGELLDRIIASVGWRRDEVYICNIVKCRPPGNRDPQLDEVATCRPFLDRQLETIRPSAIVTLGRPATSTLLGRNIAITKLRGLWQEWRGIPVMPTFHPAYLLRNYTRETRQAVWDDLRAVRALVDERAGS